MGAHQKLCLREKVSRCSAAVQDVGGCCKGMEAARAAAQQLQGRLCQLVRTCGGVPCLDPGPEQQRLCQECQKSHQIEIPELSTI